MFSRLSAYFFWIEQRYEYEQKRKFIESVYK